MTMPEWKELEQTCENCRKCGLCQERHHVVFGIGNPKADIMFIGEGPGEQEDLSGIPFVGPAGKLLDDMLSILDLYREENCYIANIVKCRPPRNRDPHDDEQDACIGYLEQQIALVKPRIIVCLGRIAAQRLIRKDFRITKEHGTWTHQGGIWYTATYHPSALLRDENKRPDAFRDLMEIRKKGRDLGVGI